MLPLTEGTVVHMGTQIGPSSCHTRKNFGKIYRGLRDIGDARWHGRQFSENFLMTS